MYPGRQNCLELRTTIVAKYGREIPSNEGCRWEREEVSSPTNVSIKELVLNICNVQKALIFSHYLRY